MLNFCRLYLLIFFKGMIVINHTLKAASLELGVCSVDVFDDG